MSDVERSANNSLAEYLKDRLNTGGGAVSLPSAKALKSLVVSGFSIQGAVGSAGADSNAEEFSGEVAALVRSDAVLGELGSEVGNPRPNETEDEFVERAKSALAGILRKKLSK